MSAYIDVRVTMREVMEQICGGYAGGLAVIDEQVYEYKRSLVDGGLYDDTGASIVVQVLHRLLIEALHSVILSSMNSPSSTEATEES